MWGSFTTPTNSSTSATCTIQFSSDTIYLELASDSAGSGLSSTRLPSLQMPVTSPRLSSVPLTDTINQGSPDHPLGFDNLLEWLTEVREICLLVYCKLIQLRNIQVEEMCRARFRGRGTELPCLLWACNLPVPQFVHQPRSSQNLIDQRFLWRLCHIGMTEY